MLLGCANDGVYAREMILSYGSRNSDKDGGSIE